MKKLFLGLGLVAGTFAFAQTSPSFGLKGGMNVSSLSKDGGLNDQESKIGFNAGVFLNAPISEQFSIQPEVLYNNLGSKITREATVNNNTYTAEYARHLDYISVPVMAQFNATPNFYIEAGPQFSFLVDARDKYKNTKNGSTQDAESYSLNKDDFKTFDFGLGLGVGYYFTPQFGINARYTAGLTDIYKSNSTSNDNVKNNVFQVGLNFRFKN
ncbi:MULTISPECIES: porin family protein [Epilithonimonas]|uniref:PorT family protein n=1 Tax=Epilithonimonas hispanica TaxID=358687 RepID=A0A3D9CXG9_9FLAO|nr:MULTISPECIES: porin family protein [Epilithonimonas]REC70449.1 PorT family protein [Epilithonimonas hispanica]